MSHSNRDSHVLISVSVSVKALAHRFTHFYLSTTLYDGELIYTFFHFSDEMATIKIPKDMDDAKALGTVLSKYKDTYYTQVLVAYFTTYILYPFG